MTPPDRPTYTDPNALSLDGASEGNPMSELSREQVEARLRPAIAEAQACGYCDGSCTSCREEAAALAPTVAAMLAEARAEVARDVRAIPAPGPFDYLADWAQYRSLVLQAVARHMPSAVREGGTERSGASGGSGAAGMSEHGLHDCIDGCTGADPAADHWNERLGHWYCANGNGNCAAHDPQDRRA